MPGPSTLRTPAITALCMACLSSPSLFAFDPPVDTVGPMTVKILGPEEIDQTGQPVQFQVELKSTADVSITGTAALSGIDGWKALPAEPVPFTVGAKGSKTLSFGVIPGPRTLDAFYPVHARVNFKAGANAYGAHAVMVVSARNPHPPRPGSAPVSWQPMQLRAEAELSLLRTLVRRPIVAVFNKPPEPMPIGWQGSEPTTRATFEFNTRIDRSGDQRAALAIHPPYHEGRIGTAAVQFPVHLPAGVPVHLRFANAIRDHDPAHEPPSDGVTFRVRIMPFAGSVDVNAGTVAFEKHTASKVWMPADIDLSQFAGKEVIVQLESHPGPKQDTTCDQSYWAEPVLVSGQRALGKGPTAAPFPPSVDAQPRLLGTLDNPGGPWQVKVWPGQRGLLDAAMGLESGERRLLFRGFRVRVNGADLEKVASTASLLGIREEPSENTCLVRHQFEDERGRFDLLIELTARNHALQAKVWLENMPAAQPWRATYLEDVAAGEWTERAARVYAGTGNVIQEPQAFDLGFDGHRLSTCFVGFDFNNRTSLVQGVDAIPNRLEVQPERRRYSLHSPHAQTLFFIPATSVWEGVQIWRELTPKANPAARSPGVQKLAGRFVFDWWGGDYEGSAKALERSFRYGLTNAVVVWHNWQRHGYDDRLPDIWPPNPKYGTQLQFKALAELCKANGVLFAPHDNYIDYYPDADGFSYDHIAFTQAGEPVKAWFNPGPKAQSYRWRADRIRPVIERNLQPIRDEIRPTAYFIDVFSSIEPYDYWTADGQFRDRRSTAKVWGDLFSWIRNYLGDDAPQISESGHDALIGDLDGAQCNHLRVGSPEGAGNDRWFLWDVRCGDAERIPWFDAAYHETFALHGAGYESRFRAGLDARQHGMYSDDYISVEVLDGHPAMVGQPFGHDVVRKYWLLNDLMSMTALAPLEKFEFADRNLHRMHLQWARRDHDSSSALGKDDGHGSSMQVWVNRSSSDWQVNGHTLPQYGWHATASDGFEAAVERSNGRTVEWSKAPAGPLYLNARASSKDARARAGGIAPLRVGPFSTNGACRFEWKPAPASLRIVPLPDEPNCTMEINVTELTKMHGGAAPTFSQMETLAENGEVLKRSPVGAKDNVITLQSEAGVFAYRLVP